MSEAAKLHSSAFLSVKNARDIPKAGDGLGKKT
jgi:hypothetical protein